LTEVTPGDTVSLMKTITIKELHEHTGEWVRKAAEVEGITVTQHGRPIAHIGPVRPQPAAKGEAGNPWLNREMLPSFAKLQERLVSGTDSTEIISRDRDGRNFTCRNRIHRLFVPPRRSPDSWFAVFTDKSRCSPSSIGSSENG
jgi:prevent-host-death family protein